MKGAGIFATLISPSALKSGGDAFNIAIMPTTLSAQANPNSVSVMDSELLLNYVGTQHVSSSVKAVRGNTTIAAGTTVDTGYLYGTQGKLTIKGILSSGSEVSCGLCGQLDLSAAQGVTAPIAAIWADCGASAGTVTGANIDAVVVYNTTAAKINAALRVDTNSSYFMDLTDEGGGHGAGNWIIAGAVGGNQDKKLKCKVKGVDYFIALSSA